jgi:hypothetical protein
MMMMIMKMIMKITYLELKVVDTYVFLFHYERVGSS